MCGIAGKLSNDPAQPVERALVQQMTDVLRHRGPDAGGVWVNGHVGLGSRRLAIIDLSPLGHQPMCNEDGSLWIVCNGEIYNFLELREELLAKGHTFRSHSDTETVLHLYEELGPECVTRLWGMFAFALWDAGRQRLLVARDRLGKKPLFYQQDDRAFRFGSEPKAILQDAGVPAEPDGKAIHYFLTYGYVPSPWSAFRGIRKLPPAHYLLVAEGRITLHRYWTLSYVPKRTEREEALGAEFLALLEDAVRRRLISDVPLGALLSGGIDSSVVVATMRRLTSGSVRTFSIGFDRPEYDELAHARTVARHFETDHHELVVKPDAVTMLPRLVWHYNEPFADSSALPSMALCEMARSSVTVALNGDGGDEAFAGYDRYVAVRLAGVYDSLPAPARWAIRRGLGLLPRGGPKSPADRARRLGEVLAMEPRRRYARWLACFDEERKAELCTPEFAAVPPGVDSVDLLLAAQLRASAPSVVEAAVEADVGLYLPDDLLVKMDIASMAHSLEVRSPFLDHRVMEFAAALPLHLKLRRLTQKYLLKRVMKDRLPATILRRTKMGFGVPIDHWFREELREMAYDVLLGERGRQRGYFRPEVVRRYLDEHVAGQAHHQLRLWALLVLELWHRTFIDQRCPVAPPAHL
jgi:asparagine synthase (glutamine-hydrolysing)